LDVTSASNALLHVLRASLRCFGIVLMNNNLKATGRFSQCNPAIPMAEPACTHSLAFLPLPGNHGTADAETDVEFSVLPDADCK
jgi:hypothetical protein